MKSKLTVDQVNTLNIGLMLVAAAAAIAKPFELFLVAYALLGPLHYLTEISWLHDKRYFTKGRHDYLFLVAVGVVVSMASLGMVGETPVWFNAVIIYVAFGSALAFVVTNKALPRILLFAALIVTSGFVAKNAFLHSTFGLLLPTIIHVFVFTGLFVLVGALKGRSLSGIGSLVVFWLCAASFFLFTPGHTGENVSTAVRMSYKGFTTLNYSLMAPFGRHDLSIPANVQEYVRFVNDVLYHTPAAYAVMGFIAFAYTYHYLNWFSKTSIIQWHNIPRPRLVGVIALWLASIGIYAYDYRLGLKWLFFLSFAHVLLEFPLNHLSFIGIGREVRRSLTPGRAQGPTVAAMSMPERKSGGRSRQR